MLLGRWLFLKNRFSSILFLTILLLAGVGLITSLISNPSGFFLNIVMLLGIGVLIWLVFQSLNKSNPQKKEQKAFLKAAKQSKKRLQTREKSPAKPSSSNRVSSLKAHKHQKSRSTANLTVIDGKKGKKKNRASF